MDLDLDTVREITEPPVLFTRPYILVGPPIPIPLHGRNPRSIKGKEWWDNERQRVYKENNFHCHACGIWKIKAPIHQWLEAHEVYTVNSRTGRMKLKEIAALCHSCHNFIHIGRLQILLRDGKIDADTFKNIILHGLKIIRENNLKIRYDVLLISELILGIDCSQYKIKSSPDYSLPWSKWYLYLDKVRYYSLFKDGEEWKQYYLSKGDNEDE